MIEALLICVAAFAVGFAVAWTLGGRTRERLASVTARAEEQARAAEDKLELVAEARSSLASTFKALSADALNASNASFLDLAKATLDKYQERAHGDLAAREHAVQSLVQPIRESLAHVDGKIGDLEKAREHAYSALNEQLRGLVETHLPMLRTETSNLVRALRQPTVRGRWGEMQLKRVVELAGMLEHCDFTQQESRAVEDGRQRPDLVVRLPGGRQVVVDAKAPLAAFLDAADAADDETRAQHLKRHALAVRAHVTALGRKAYWDAFEQSPELVILFLPNEALYHAALQSDPELIEVAATEKVVLASPSSLITLLSTLAVGWREEALARNAEEVAALGRELYDRVATLAGHWSEVGDKLGKTVVAYNKSVGSLERRVLVSARRFAELKAAPEGAELEAPELVEIVPQALQAPELVAAASAEKAERVARIGG
jgi:DNA recombination protein RmuC